MAWNSSSNNTWSSASLNTGTLNGTYLSGLGTWASMIVEHDWEVGGMANSRTNTAKQYYATELGNSDGNSITYRAKIGLMYVSMYYLGSLIIQNPVKKQAFACYPRATSKIIMTMKPSIVNRAIRSFFLLV